MKRLLIILILLIASPCFAQCPEENLPPLIQLARMNVTVLGGGVAAAPAGCDTVVLTNTGTSAMTQDINDSDSYTYVGHHFIDLGANKDVCKATFYISQDTGDISGKTFYAYIYTNDGSGNLDTLLGTSSGVTGSNAWSETAVEFTFSPAVTMENGVNHAVTVSMAGGADALNYAEIHYTNSGAIGGLHGRWNSDLSRSGSSSGDCKIILYTE